MRNFILCCFAIALIAASANASMLRHRSSRYEPGVAEYVIYAYEAQVFLGVTSDGDFAFHTNKDTLGKAFYWKNDYYNL